MKQSNNLTILAIETSCDDTCVAIIKVKSQKSKVKSFNVLSNVVSSQVQIHKKWGGVYPALAKREHQKNLPIILKKVLKKTKIDLVAVTIGPGLEPCLWVGVNFAKDLAKKLNVPIVPVNHIEGHIVVNFVDKVQNSKFKSQNFPAVCLVVSGGHTQLILMRDIGKYKILGETRDDAAGECFDKVARILGLGYPGGPALAAAAAKLPITNYQLSINLPRPMINQKNYDFSFSGLKTAVLYNYKKHSKEEMAKETQQAIIDVLIKKTIKAAKDYRAKTIILGGGVSANQELRKQFKLKMNKFLASKCENCKATLRGVRLRASRKINFWVPPKNLCTDNAVMTAVAGYYNKKKVTKNYSKIRAISNLKIN